MYLSLNCIALKTVRYSDRNSILSVYTRQAGRMSLLVPAGTGRSASRLRALLMPLGRFDCVADIRPGRDIHSFRDVRPVVLPPAADPLKASLAMFVTEMLNGLLREAQSDPHLFDYIDRSLRLLAASGKVGAMSGDGVEYPLTAGQLCNFHICFLMGLSRFLGIEPDWGSYREGCFFDLAGGVFVAAQPPHRHFLPPGEAAAAYQLSRMTFSNSGHFKMSRFYRNLVLDRILLYFQTHFPSLPEPTSLTILRMMAD